MKPLRIFTPSMADQANTNAQNLTVKEIITRLPSEEFHVTMLVSEDPDPRILARKNTRLLRYHTHGNTLRVVGSLLLALPDVYFFPRYGPADQTLVSLRRTLHLRTALVSYMVMMMNKETVSPFIDRLVRESDVVVGNSQYVSQTIHDHFGVTAETIHSGIDTRFFFSPKQRDSASNRKLVVLYAGSFQARKRVPLLVRFAANWPNVEFRLAGKGEEEVDCHRLIQKLGCRNVTFLGHLSSHQLGDEMRNADIFAFPSMLEGHPQVLGQAAACGLPCVAMNVYRPDYVVQGKTGFLVESDEEFADRLALLLTNSELRKTFSLNAAEHASQFSWDRVTEQWAEVFRTAVKRRGSR